MKRNSQEIINGMVIKAYEKALIEWNNLSNEIEYKRLRTCQATVGESENYYYLVSYQTLVAFIDKSDDTLYDVLRYVYGYTSTSSHHIAKFNQDYGGGKWECTNRMTYYSIG